MAANTFEDQLERLELKYLLDEPRARRVRRQIRAYCRADPHNESDASGRCTGYPVQSLYLDISQLRHLLGNEIAGELGLVRGFNSSDGD